MRPTLAILLINLLGGLGADNSQPWIQPDLTLVTMCNYLR